MRKLFFSSSFICFLNAQSTLFCMEGSTFYEKKRGNVRYQLSPQQYYSTPVDTNTLVDVALWHPTPHRKNPATEVGKKVKDGKRRKGKRKRSHNKWVQTLGDLLWCDATCSPFCACNLHQRRCLRNNQSTCLCDFSFSFNPICCSNLWDLACEHTHTAVTHFQPLQQCELGLLWSAAKAAHERGYF